MVKEAGEIIAEMDDNDVEIDEYMQSALTTMYIEAEMLEKSWSWFRRFHFTDTRNVQEAMSYVEAMKEVGIPGNSVIYNSLIKLYTKVGYVSEAEVIYRKLLGSCNKTQNPDVYTSNCLINLYSERSMVRKAEAIFERVDVQMKMLMLVLVVNE